MNILITGGAGFIGSHLVDACIANGHTIAIIDNLSTGRQDNLKEALQSGKATLYMLDITDKEALLTIFESFKPDVVYHLAGQINVRTSMKDPVDDARINIIGGLNVLECMRTVGCKRIIFSSTGGALFDDNHLPYNETMTPSPCSPYGIAKWAFEQYLDFYKKYHGFETTILRYANVYWPRQNPHWEAGVISIFLDKIQKKETPVIYGDGTQTRDFIHVDDVISANLHVLKNGLTGTYHVGTGRETSINELWKILSTHYNAEMWPLYVASLGEIQRSALDPQKLEKTGWIVTKYIQDVSQRE